MRLPIFPKKGPASCESAPDPEIFFPEPYEIGSVEKSNIAKKFCESCVYVQECLTWALEENEPGVWGNTSENERRTIRRRANRLQNLQEESPLE